MQNASVRAAAANSANETLCSVYDLVKQSAEQDKQIDDLINRMAKAAEDLLLTHKGVERRDEIIEGLRKDIDHIRASLRQELQTNLGLRDLIGRLQKELHTESMRPFRNIADTVVQQYTEINLNLQTCFAEKRHLFDRDSLEFACDWLDKRVFMRPRRPHIRFAMIDNIFSDRAIEGFAQEVASLLSERIANDVREQLTKQRGSVRV